MRAKLFAIVKVLLRHPHIYIKQKKDRVMREQLIIGESCGVKFSVRDRTDTYWHSPIACGLMATFPHERHGLGS